MLRGLYAFCVLVIITLVCAIPAGLYSLLRPGSDFAMRAARLWGRTMLRAVGARLECAGLEHLSSRMPCIYIVNHQSNVDIWALLSVIPPPTRFVAKKSLFHIPVLGWAMAATGFIPIDRTNRGRAMRSLKAAADKVRAGRPVLLFPEGTRSRSGALQPFKKGPFHLALQAGVPVVPIVISGSWNVLPPKSLRVSPGPVQVSCLPPVEIGEFLPTDYKGLLGKVHEVMERALSE
jgi:1-acyl-sn-glycerol-3-phosphate acyltransferase